MFMQSVHDTDITLTTSVFDRQQLVFSLNVLIYMLLGDIFVSSMSKNKDSPAAATDWLLS